MFKTAPMFSIGTSRRSTDMKTEMSENPGPGTYSPENLHTHGPIPVIGSAIRDNSRMEMTPGPGAYDPLKLTKKSPAYHIAARSSSSFRNSTPGPGAYQSDKVDRSKHRAPSYSFRLKVPERSPDRSPGPADYDQNSDILYRTHSVIKIGTARRDYYKTEVTPGPGSYDNKPDYIFGIRQRAPSYVIGTERRDRDILIEQAKTLPGPGSYSLKSLFDGGLARAATLVSRRPDFSNLERMRVPGPGSYNPDFDNKTRAPSHRIGTSLQREDLPREKVYVPGPGNYDPEKYKPKKNAVIGTSKRKPLNEAEDTPGPGAYNTKRIGRKGPSYPIGQKIDLNLKLKQDQSTPGPSNYSPTLSQTKKRVPAHSIGTSERENAMKSLLSNPGPGQYDPAKKEIHGPKWRFGTASKDSRSNSPEWVPGPGAYDMPQGFGLGARGSRRESYGAKTVL